MLAVLSLSVLLLLFQGFIGLHSNDLFVSHSGKDFSGCGYSSIPCATVRFAVVNESRPGDTINIDYYNGKPYCECTYALPIMINKSLSLVGRNGKAIIECILQRSLFVISGNRVKVLLFENLVLRNAKKAIDQRFTGPYLTIKRCILTRNSIAVMINTTRCLLNVFNSTFENNFDMGIESQNLSYVRANVISSNFYSSYVMFRAFLPTKLIKMFISRCNFSLHDKFAETVAKPGVDAVLGLYYRGHANVVEIEIYECLFANFGIRKGHWTYGVVIASWYNFIDNRKKINIILDRLTFENNKFQGSAIFLNDFSKSLSTPHYKIVNCVFNNNTNPTIYTFMSASLIKSVHDDNGTRLVLLQNNTFIKNYDLGWPISELEVSSTLYLNGKFRIISCRFFDNSHASSASVVYISDSTKVSFKDCYFENSQVGGDSLQINAVASSTVKFIGHNQFNIRRLRSDQFVFNHGYDAINASVNNNFLTTILGSFTVQCPTAFRLYDQNKIHEALTDRVSFISLAISCKQCSLKTYSYERGAIYNRTLAQIKCHTCPMGGQCEDGKLTAKANFWGYENQKQVSFLSCPSGYCCHNGSCNSYNSCYGNRTGPLCGRCPEGMSEPIFSIKCKANEECKDYTFWVRTSVLSLFTFLFFLYQNEIITFLKRGLSFRRFLKFPSLRYLEVHDEHSSSAPEGGNESMGHGFLKILFYYYQVLYIFKSCGDWNDKQNLLGGLQYVFINVFNLIIININFYDLTCPLQNITPVKKIVLLRSLGFSLLGMLLLTWLLLKIFRLVKNRKVASIDTVHHSEIILHSVNPQSIGSNVFQTFSIRIVCAFIHISFLMYSSSAQLVFILLRCVSFGDHQILFIDGTVQCYQPFQYFLIAYAVVSIVPFFLVPVLGLYVLTTGLISVSQFCLGCLFPLPLCCYWFYLLVKQNLSPSEGDVDLNMEDGEMVENSVDVLSKKVVIDCLSGPFRSQDRFLCFCTFNLRLPWESVLVLRKLIIIIASTFIYESRLRMVIILTICVIILVSHLYVKPFKDAINNILETLSLSILTILCGFTLMKALLYHNEDYSSYLRSSEFIHKFDLTESILVLTPVAIVILITALCIVVRLGFLVSFCLKLVYRKLGDLLDRATCLSV